MLSIRKLCKYTLHRVNQLFTHLVNVINFYFTATYNLSIKVGDVKGSGTDGNVYIQLFGERGNTAKIQLRQAGDTRNKFEKGRTYKFTVDTVDIGKVTFNLQTNILSCF